MADANGLVLGYVVCADAAEARRMADVLVNEKLAACANIVTGVHSVFLWQSEVTSADEVLLLMKTLAEKIPAVERRIKSMHSYDVPCICFYAAQHVNPEYAEWVRESLR